MCVVRYFVNRAPDLHGLSHSHNYNYNMSPIHLLQVSCEFCVICVSTFSLWAHEIFLRFL